MNEGCDISKLDRTFYSHKEKMGGGFISITLEDHADSSIGNEGEKGLSYDLQKQNTG